MVVRQCVGATSLVVSERVEKKEDQAAKDDDEDDGGGGGEEDGGQEGRPCRGAYKRIM